MPDIETIDQTDDAVLWEKEGVNREDSTALLGEPRPVKVQWIEDQREGTRSDGTPVMLDVTLATDLDLQIGSILWLGEFQELGPTRTPPDDVYEVVNRSKARSIGGGKYTRREYGLKRYGLLPALAE